MDCNVISDSNVIPGIGSFGLVKFNRFYGVLWRVSRCGFSWFEILASVGSSSYSVGGFMETVDGKDDFCVTDMSSVRAEDAFYDSLPRCKVPGMRVIAGGYDASDPVLVDFLDFLKERYND